MLNIVSKFTLSNSQNVQKTSVKNNKNRSQYPEVPACRTSSVPMNYYSKIAFRGYLQNSSEEKLTDIFQRLSIPLGSSKVVDELDLLSKEEKVKFVEIYKEKTGFPDLKEVSKRIEIQAQNAVIQAEKDTGIRVLMSSYNNTCSVGKGVALPGSDIDGWFTVIDSDNPDDKHNFIGRVKELVDPLLLAVVHTRTDDLPDIVTKNELFKSLDDVDSVFRKDEELNSQDSIEHFEQKQNTLYDDWIEAGEFNIKVAKQLENESKTPMLRAGFVVENLREGKVFLNNLNSEEMSKINNSSLYKYTNSQQERMHQHTLKEKHLARIEALNNFDDLAVEDQFEVIKSIIKISYKDQKQSVRENESSFFKNHGCGNMDALMKKLLSKEHGGE